MVAHLGQARGPAPTRQFEFYATYYHAFQQILIKLAIRYYMFYYILQALADRRVNEMLMRKPAANKMAGLTLLETMFALVVGAFVLISTVILYKSIRQSATVSQVMSDMNSIRAGYKSYLSSGYKFDATTDILQLQAVQGAGFLPSTLNNPWGLAYTVSVSNSKYLGYIVIGIPGLDTSGNDPRCNAIWKAAEVTGALSTSPSNVGNINCAFRYRFP